MVGKVQVDLHDCNFYDSKKKGTKRCTFPFSCSWVNTCLELKSIGCAPDEPTLSSEEIDALLTSITKGDEDDWD